MKNKGTVCSYFLLRNAFRWILGAKKHLRCSHIWCPYHSAFEISRRSFCWSSLSMWWLSFLVIRFLGRVIPEPLLEPCSLGCESRNELMGNSMEYLSLFGGCKASICLAIFKHCAGFLANGTIGPIFTRFYTSQVVSRISSINSIMNKYLNIPLLCLLSWHHLCLPCVSTGSGPLFFHEGNEQTHWRCRTGPDRCVSKPSREQILRLWNRNIFGRFKTRNFCLPGNFCVLFGMLNTLSKVKWFKWPPTRWSEGHFE